MGTANQNEVLERIATTLEFINSNLSDINASLDNIDQNMKSCISRVGNNHFICITGNVSNY